MPLRPTPSPTAVSRYNYNFDGITFFTSQSPSSQLGAFVAAAGPNAFVIGAPNYTGGGRLYYITAIHGVQLAHQQASLTSTAHEFSRADHSSPSKTRPIRMPGLAGSSFAVITNLFGDGSYDIAIGEPRRRSL